MAATMTAADVARLLGRTAFGATSADLDQWTGKPYADLVDHLLQPSALPTAAPLPDDGKRVLLEHGQPDDVYEARRWWLERMRTTPFPLVERVTMLWHGHFATGVRYPPSVAQMVVQNQTLRAHALGSLKDLVNAVTLDPAMLVWLNGFENTTPHPNENYAREFFELFTLGKHPQVYTEKDVREAAKSFTGWILDANGSPSFVAGRHDQRNKRILGTTVANAGNTEYTKVTDVALGQPVSARFFAYKLVANLGYLPNTPDLLKSKDKLLNRVADSLRKDWSIANALRTLFLSDEFRYAPPAMGRQLVRTPVECVVHAAKALDVAFDDLSLVWQLERMGHSLFNPTDVSGWPLGRDWVSPVTALARYDTGLTLYYAAAGDAKAKVAPLPAPTDVTAWARRLGVAAFGKNTVSAVNAYVRQAQKQTSTGELQAGVLTLLLSSPEWVVM